MMLALEKREERHTHVIVVQLLRDFSWLKSLGQLMHKPGECKLEEKLTTVGILS